MMAGGADLDGELAVVVDVQEDVRRVTEITDVNLETAVDNNL